MLWYEIQRSQTNQRPLRVPHESRNIHVSVSLPPILCSMISKQQLNSIVHFRCNICSKLFPRKSDLSAHISQHKAVETKRFSCSECGKVWKSKYRLEKHKLTHGQKMPALFPCDYCNRKWVKQSWKTKLIIWSAAESLLIDILLNSSNLLLILQYCNILSLTSSQ